jgi:hypothetical protein
MSITFYNDVKSNWVIKASVCYCAENNIDQLAMDPSADKEAYRLSQINDKIIIYNSATKEEKDYLFSNIHRFAKKDCYYCKGVGVGVERDWNPPIFINWSNGNASLILSLLDVPEDDLPAGRLTLFQARQKLLKALNLPVDKAVRQEETIYAKPRQNEDGSIELKPIRFHSSGLHESDIVERLNKLMEFVVMSQNQGATEISWG